MTCITITDSTITVQYILSLTNYSILSLFFFLANCQVNFNLITGFSSSNIHAGQWIFVLAELAS